MDNSETENLSEELSPDDNQEEITDELSFGNDKIVPTGDLLKDIKMYFRLAKRTVTSYLRERMSKSFTNIVYLTLNCPDFVSDCQSINTPTDFIERIRKQYPLNDIRLLVPILNLPEDFKPSKKITLKINGQVLSLDKTSISFDYYAQNNTWNAVIYKFEKNESNTQVYGIYSSAFSYITDINEFKTFETLVHFMRAARYAIRNLKKDGFIPDIVHSDRLPFYMGAEFDSKILFGVKVLQIIDDFTYEDLNKQEPFWALINLADKNSIKKLLNDVYIKKCIFELFENHPAIETIKITECLDLIFKNYKNFQAYQIEENKNLQAIIFKHLNSRVMKLFPNLIPKGSFHFYPIMQTLKKADFWATISKTYYKLLFEDSVAPEIITKQLIKTADKSSYVYTAINNEKYSPNNENCIYQTFNSENFRDLRCKNKAFLIKELSSEKIKTGFVSPKLFKSENPEIYGYLDSFYEAPLLFANIEPVVFGGGLDILFNTILKLFELNKNIQIIISAKYGMPANLVKAWVEFLEENSSCAGRWALINGEVSLPQFLASSDILLVPDRTNTLSLIHLLSMRYGCVPVASKTGYINDSLVDIFDDIQTGCGFKTDVPLLKENSNSIVFYDTLIKALNLYNNNHSSWNIIVKNCLNNNSDWNFEKLEKYNKIYREIL